MKSHERENWEWVVIKTNGTWSSVEIRLSRKSWRTP